MRTHKLHSTVKNKTKNNGSHSFIQQIYTEGLLLVPENLQWWVQLIRSLSLWSLPSNINQTVIQIKAKLQQYWQRLWKGKSEVSLKELYSCLDQEDELTRWRGECSRQKKNQNKGLWIHLNDSQHSGDREQDELVVNFNKYLLSTCYKLHIVLDAEKR